MAKVYVFPDFRVKVGAKDFGKPDGFHVWAKFHDIIWSREELEAVISDLQMVLDSSE